MSLVPTATSLRIAEVGLFVLASRPEHVLRRLLGLQWFAPSTLPECISAASACPLLTAATCARTRRPRTQRGRVLASLAPRARGLRWSVLGLCCLLRMISVRMVHHLFKWRLAPAVRPDYRNHGCPCIV
eukprot:1186518-Amphidinium_carterae.1